MSCFVDTGNELRGHRVMFVVSVTQLGNNALNDCVIESQSTLTFLDN